MLVLQAPPGAGKSTVLPLELLNEPWMDNRRMVILQPRRIAARSVAVRMAQQLGEEPGLTVGYRVRFENVTSPSTRIIVVTEGVLTRMLQDDNSLEDVAMVIFDEFHERSLHADLALALCRECRQVLREDLRLLVMSATLNSDDIASQLGAPVIRSEGRQYPVTMQYFPFAEHVPLHDRMMQAIKVALKNETGDILAFLPGTGEIRKVLSMAQEMFPHFDVLPLYGDLPFSEQQKALMPSSSSRRRIILSTSIAETSVTIEGVGVVIDCGYARLQRFDPDSGLTRLETVRITADAAAQRAGRAGRMGPGVCYRLWSEGSQVHLVASRKPEILDADLASAMLEAAQWTGGGVASLPWLTPPPAGSVASAWQLLQSLGALKDNQVTDKGKKMLKVPAHPRIAHMLLAGSDPVMMAAAADIAALLDEKDMLGRDQGSDLSLRVDMLRRWRSGERVPADRALLDRLERSSQQWRKILRVAKDDGSLPYGAAGRLLAMAYPERIAKRTGAGPSYRLSNGRKARMHDHDAMVHEAWIVIASMDAGSAEGKIFLSATMDPSDLSDLAIARRTIRWDDTRGVIYAAEEMCIGDLPWQTRPIGALQDEEALPVLVELVRKEGPSILLFTEETDAYAARIASLRRWRPAEGWPDIGRANLQETCREWLAAWAAGFRKKDDFRRLDMLQVMKSLLPWELQQRADMLAPAALKVPSGFDVPLRYAFDGSVPVLAVRLQEMFGLLETPLINEGRTAVMLHLLSPGYKPVQVTQDLRSFWTNTYPEVRKELRIRYPRHAWPDDPFTAAAVRGVKKKTQ
jgi:ATP-dependent helicase HrpB